MKDYYAILGVVPNAEDIVIKAAYKALAQRYHPDRNPDSPDAAKRMAEINEAYQVLSDPPQRKAYDQERGTKEQDFTDWSREEEAEETTSSTDPFEADWQVAIKYYPDLEEINRRLMRTSRLLAFTFRATILDTKVYDARNAWAELLETGFLMTYFGDHPKLVDFARTVISQGNKAAAKALNQAVRVLGASSADVIIQKVCADYGIETPQMRDERLKKEAKQQAAIAGLTDGSFAEVVRIIESGSMNYKDRPAIELTRFFGGTVTSSTGDWYTNPSYKVAIDGRQLSFANFPEFNKWVNWEIVPKAKAFMSALK